MKTRLSTGGCLTTSEFVFTTEQRDRSRENAREGHRPTYSAQLDTRSGRSRKGRYVTLMTRLFVKLT